MPSGRSQRYDQAIIVGTALALFCSFTLGVGVLSLVAGSLPLAAGLYRYVPREQHLVQGLAGLLAVVFGGMVPSSVLVGSRAGDWLVGSDPFPLVLGMAIAVVLGVLVLRRSIRSTLDVGVDPRSYEGE